jgi:uridine nucleosidase
VPLDLTHQVLATPQVLRLLKFGHANNSDSDPNPPAPVSGLRMLFNEIMTFFAATYVREFAMTTGPPLHDPLAVAAVLAPLLFNDNDGERYHVHVVREGDSIAVDDDDDDDTTVRTAHVDECGRTLVRRLEKGQQGVRIPRTVDDGVFWNIIDLALASCEKESRVAFLSD